MAPALVPKPDAIINCVGKPYEHRLGPLAAKDYGDPLLIPNGD